MKLKHIVEYENILDDFNVGYCVIKVKVTITLTKFNQLISKSPADGSSLQIVIKVIAKETNNTEFYTVKYVWTGIAQFVWNLLSMQVVIAEVQDPRKLLNVPCLASFGPKHGTKL